MKKWIVLLATILLAASLLGCAGGSGSSSASVQSAEPLTAEYYEESTSSESSSAAAESGSAVSIDEALAENQETHTSQDATAYDASTAVSISLDGASITVDGTGVQVDGSTATITSAGTYRLSGSLSDGQVIVNTEDQQAVTIVLDGADLHSSTSSPLYIVKAEEVVIVLAGGSANSLSDGDSYVLSDPESDEPNAALFSAADLTITGSGSLSVTGNSNDGIASKDGLVIAGGTLTVQAADDGIRGKDYLVIQDGSLSVTAGGDGLKSDNAEEAGRGYILVENGLIQVTAGGDGLAAESDVLIRNGQFNLVSGGGSRNWVDENTSAKGIKGVASVVIDGGTFTIDSADDAIHSNGSITINAGGFTLATGDDGIHADATLEINEGEIAIPQSYEGLESAVISLNGGTIHIVSSDDGINVASGMDGSGGMRPGGGQGVGQSPDAFTYTGSYYLYIRGGYIAVEASGDGLDINGAVEMSGGVVIVNGPTENMNGALDYDGGFQLTGGFLVAAGSAGMAMAPDSSSSQPSLLANLSASLPAGTLFHIQDSFGNEILTFSPTKTYQSVVFSSPDLLQGETYTLYTGGSSSGALQDSLYLDGSYSPGDIYETVTLSSIVTTVGAGGFGPGAGGRRRP